MEKWEYSAEERLTELNLTCIQVTSGDSEALVVSAAGRVVTLQLYVPISLHFLFHIMSVRE